MEEYHLETTPTNSDTDKDGIPDGEDPNPLVAAANDSSKEKTVLDHWRSDIAIIIAVVIALALLFKKKKLEPAEQTDNQSSPDTIQEEEKTDVETDEKNVK